MLNQKNDLNDKPSEEDLELAASIARGLTPTASAEERTNALLLAGFSVEELSLALGVSENTVRNWAEGSAQPRRPVERALDDLRTVMVALDEAGIRTGCAVETERGLATSVRWMCWQTIRCWCSRRPRTRNPKTGRCTSRCGGSGRLSALRRGERSPGLRHPGRAEPQPCHDAPAPALPKLPGCAWRQAQTATTRSP